MGAGQVTRGRVGGEETCRRGHGGKVGGRADDAGVIEVRWGGRADDVSSSLSSSFLSSDGKQESALCALPAIFFSPVEGRCSALKTTEGVSFSLSLPLLFPVSMSPPPALPHRSHTQKTRQPNDDTIPGGAGHGVPGRAEAPHAPPGAARVLPAALRAPGHAAAGEGELRRELRRLLGRVLLAAGVWML